MKKIITPLVTIIAFTLLSQRALSAYVSNNEFTCFKNRFGGKEKKMNIVSSRAGGNVQVRFTAEKSGEVTITVLNEASKIVLQQQSQISDGINTINIKNLLTLNEGSYTVDLVSQKDTYSSGFLFWK